jgi:hypothetical protein
MGLSSNARRAAVCGLLFDLIVAVVGGLLFIAFPNPAPITGYPYYESTASDARDLAIAFIYLQLIFVLLGLGARHIGAAIKRRRRHSAAGP